MDRLVKLGLLKKLKNFILERKMRKLNQNKNSKQPEHPGAAWKIYSTWEINE